MRPLDRFRSLHGNGLSWLIAPFTFILAAALGWIACLFWLGVRRLKKSHQKPVAFNGPRKMINKYPKPRRRVRHDMQTDLSYKQSESAQLSAPGEAAPGMQPSYAEMARQNAAYRDGLRHYVEAITRSQEDERLRISRELHDDTIQNLLAMYRRTEFLAATETDEHKRQQLETLHDTVGQTLEGVRLISQDLRPMMLDDLGFVPAVQMLVRKAHQGPGAVPDARLEVRGTARPLPAEVELAMYRIVQEALSNVRKHAHATSVVVTIDYQPTAMRLSVADDGAGFVVPESFTDLVQSSHLGLMGIQERVWAVDGLLEVDSVIEQGTKVKIVIPV